MWHIEIHVHSLFTYIYEAFLFLTNSNKKPDLRTRNMQYYAALRLTSLMVQDGEHFDVICIRSAEDRA